MIIDFGIDVKHGYLSKEFRVVFLSCDVVLIDHVLPDFFFYLFLGLHVKDICIV